MVRNRRLLVAVIGGVIIGTGILTSHVHAGSRVKSTSERGWWKQGGVFHAIPELPPNPAAMEAKTLLDGASPEPWGADWSERTGLPKRMWGTTSRRYLGSPDEIAREFLAEFRPLFTGLAPADDPAAVTFEQKEVIIDGGEEYTTVLFRQSFKGIEVYRSGVFVRIDRDGHVISIGGSRCVIVDIDLTPGLTADAAIAALRTALLPDSMLSSEPSLVIYPRTHPPSLAYMVRAGVSWGRNFWTNLFFIDATTGAILRASPLHTADLKDTPSRPPSDSTSPRDRIQDLLQLPWHKRIPVIQIPRDDSSTHRDAPPDADTTEPIPRSYKLNPDQLSEKEELGRQLTASASVTGASVLAWFYSATYSQQLTSDMDSDGYDGWATLEWDADTFEPELELKAVVYARDSQENVLLLGSTYWYTITGVDPDSMSMSFNGPYREEWDFRIALVDRSEDTLCVLEYGDEPEGGGIPENIKMERIQEDWVFIELDSSVDPSYRPGTDIDDDGYFASCTLTCDVKVLYDSTYTLCALIKAKNAAEDEILVGISEPFVLSRDSMVTQGFPVDPFPGAHDEWNIYIEIVAIGCIDYCVLTYLPYGTAPDWIDIPGERWNEDSRETTVFVPNPIHSLNNVSLWDMSDWVGAVPTGREEGAYFVVDLSRLDEPLPFFDYILEGDWVKITDFPEGYHPTNPAFGRPHIAPPESPDGAFPFLRDKPGFEAVMCYHFIDMNQAYVQDLGFESACNRQIEVDPHALDGEENAFYSLLAGHPFGSGVLVFGDGGTDTGEDAEVILHEYAHAIEDNITLGILAGGHADLGYGDETLAMNQGLGDYWSASWTDSFYSWSAYPSERFAEWAARDEEGDDPYLRMLNTNKTYPADMTGNPSNDGEIWSACLWELKNETGKRVTDSVVLRSFELMRVDDVEDPSFAVGAEYIFIADTVAYQASHSRSILEIFLGRGIIECDCPCHTDPQCDGIGPNVLDVVQTVNVAFRGAPATNDPYCPHSSPSEGGRTDVDCNDVTNVVDVVLVVNVAFRGGTPASNFCANPCDAW